ncbi:MAG: tetratricopeptide repeat protein [Fibrobacterota bacterium]
MPSEKQHLENKENPFAEAAELLASSDFESARIIIESLEGSADSDPEFFFLKALLKYNLGALDLAVGLFEKAAELDPNDFRFRFNKGIVLQESGKFEAAAAEYKSALALKPNDPELHNNLAGVLFRAGNTDEALSHINLALENSEDPGIYNNLGVILGGKKEFSAAADAFRKAVERRPDYHEAWYNLGTEYLRAGDSHEASVSFQRCIDLDPEFSDAYRGMGDVYSRHNPEKALSFYEKSLSLENDDVYASASAGSMCTLTGEYLRAEYFFKKACRLLPENLSYAASVLEIMIIRGEYQSALRFAESCRGFSEDPRQVPLYCRILLLNKEEEAFFDLLNKASLWKDGYPDSVISLSGEVEEIFGKDKAESMIAICGSSAE